MRSVRVNNVSDLFELGFERMNGKRASNRDKYIYSRNISDGKVDNICEVPDGDI